MILIFAHRTVVYVTETSSKMASRFSQKLSTIFYQKVQNFEYFAPYDFKKSIFTVNLPFKLFRATVSNADTRSLKSLSTFLGTYLDHVLAKFEPNLMVPNIQNFEVFKDKPIFFSNHS